MDLLTFLIISTMSAFIFVAYLLSVSSTIAGGDAGELVAEG
jgi:hypothetical protein